jgi:hypothetical protein
MFFLLRAAGLAIAIWMLTYGLRLRDDVWRWSSPIRYTDDIANGLRQGNAVLDEGAALAQAEGDPSPDGTLWTARFLHGYLERYDTVVEQAPPDKHFSLDYSPARLLVMSTWARYVRSVDPSGVQFAEHDALPLLRLNTACDIAAAFFIFLLVRHWILRSRPCDRETAWMFGLVAALVSWFNPSTLIDAHMWPQWDVWIVPCYLAAMYLASTQWWFAAGMAIAIGAMFKGQMLMVAPVMVLWPLFGGKWSAAMRISIGFLFAAALMASPWLARNQQAWEWITLVLLLSIALVIVSKLGVRIAIRRGWPIWSVIPIVALICEPCGFSNADTLLLGAAIALTPFLARRLKFSGSAVWLSVIMTASILVASRVFDGTWSWWWVGFEFGTRHALHMINGTVSNLAALLAEVYNWRLDDLVGRLGTYEITIKTLLVTIYACTLVLSAFGAAMHDRRKDARALIALTAPWVLMFTLLPQMHERYLMWAAAMCGVAIASSVGMGLLHLFVIGISITMIGGGMIWRNPGFLPGAASFVAGTRPGIAWMLLLIAAIYLFLAITPRPRRQQSP